MLGGWGESKKAKIFITLSKSKDFDKKMEEFNEIRKFNEEIARIDFDKKMEEFNEIRKKNEEIARKEAEEKAKK